MQIYNLSEYLNKKRALGIFAKLKLRNHCKFTIKNLLSYLKCYKLHYSVPYKTHDTKEKERYQISNTGCLRTFPLIGRSSFKTFFYFIKIFKTPKAFKNKQNKHVFPNRLLCRGFLVTPLGKVFVKEFKLHEKRVV